MLTDKHWRKPGTSVSRVVSSEEEMNTHFPTRRLRVDVINDLKTFAIYRARPHANSQEYLSQTLPT